MSDTLQHHGVKGMHWGIRRYQPYPKGSKHKGKEIGEAAKRTETSSKPKMSREEAKALYEERKKKALKSGTADDILKFKGDLTNQQMETAIKRMNLEKQLSNYDKPRVKSAKEKIDDAMKDVRTITNWMNIGIDAYNTFVRIYNTSRKKGEKKMKLVQGSGNGGNKGKKGS